MGIQRAKQYTIERSIDQINWKFIARFEEGQPSRFGGNFDEQVAIAEAYSYKNRNRISAQQKEFVRLIMEI